jgi:hypothetical protein
MAERADTTMSISGDRFSEQEMARILERAARESHSSSVRRPLPATGAAGGFDLAEIESIAREAELDVAGVHEAAIQVALDRSRGRTGDTGRIELIRRVPGVVSPVDFGKLAETIGDAAGVTGVRSATFGALDWEEARGAERLQVTVSPGDESTSVRLRTDASAVKGLCYVASVGGALALGGITGAILEPASALVGVGIMATAATAGATAGWAIWRARARRLRARAASVFASVTRRTAELASPPDGSQESR